LYEGHRGVGGGGGGGVAFLKGGGVFAPTHAETTGMSQKEPNLQERLLNYMQFFIIFFPFGTSDFEMSGQQTTDTKAHMALSKVN
jgi:hypothetical protein